jgi:hypothetical protein
MHWIDRALVGIAGLALATLIVLAATACGGNDDGPAGTPSPSPGTPAASPTTPGTPPPTNTPGPERAGEAGFRDFVQQLDAKLRAGQIDEVFARLRVTPYTCKEGDTAAGLGQPDCETVGETIRSFPSANWRSEGRLVKVERVVERLQEAQAAIRPDAQDNFGGPDHRVYAIAIGDEGMKIVTTAIIRRPAGIPGVGPIRVVHVFDSDYDTEEQRWELTGILFAYVLPEDFLRPTDEGRAYLGGFEKLGE